jgi:hypothetical protein
MGKLRRKAWAMPDQRTMNLGGLYVCVANFRNDYDYYVDTTLSKDIVAS